MTLGLWTYLHRPLRRLPKIESCYDGRMREVRPNPKAGRSIFVAGVSRNAVAEAVAQLNADARYRVLYEPFNQWYYSRLWGLRYPAYLPRTSQRHDIAVLFDRILSGRVHRTEIDLAKAHAGIRTRVTERIIRECRCNLWLDHLQARYPFMPIVLTWRHPCATIASRLLLDWTPQLKRQLVLKDIIRDHLEPFMPEIAKAREPLDQHAFMWAIHHYVPLRQFAKGSIHFAFYESLVSQATAGERLCAYAQREAPRAPSADARQRREQVSVLDTWRRQLRPGQVRRIMAILGIFGLDKIYSEATYPDEGAAYEMLSA